jgi:acyl dehydratase
MEVEQAGSLDAARPRPALLVGARLPEHTYRLTRADLVRYAGASGDFNPIHWSDRIAISVGLPGVIAHGVYTMALAGRAIAAWVGDPGAIVEYGVRFTKPVVVPDTDEGVEVTVAGVVKGRTDDGYLQIDVTTTCNGERVLGQARALVRASGQGS